MDKKTLLGLLIIGVILFSFSWYNSKQQSQFDEAKTLVDSLNAANAAAVQQTQKARGLDVAAASFTPRAVRAASSAAAPSLAGTS